MSADLTPLISLDARRRVTFQRQSEAAECGLACVAMVAGFHGLKVDMFSLRRNFEVSLKGATLPSILSILDSLRLSGRAVRLDIDEVKDLSLPAILHWNMDHFVVLSKKFWRGGAERYVIHDPAFGERELTRRQLSDSFTGIAVEVEPCADFRRRTEKVTLRISQLWDVGAGIYTPLIQITLLSITLQALTLAAPFYFQLAIDAALPTNDRDLLVVLACGFAGLGVFGLAVGALRDLILLRLSSLLSFRLVNSLFRRLIRLPLGYFEKRHTGDILSRFESTQPISDVISHGLISAGIDGLMAIMTLAVMVAYAPVLAALSIVAIGLLILLRYLWFGALRVANVSAVAARAAEASTLIETVRGVASIKLVTAEGDRQRLWANKRAQVINTGIKLGRIQMVFDLSTNAVLSIERIAFVYLAVKLAMDARMTIGMIFAFQALKENFIGSATRLVGQWIQFKMLDVHLDRIADIALSTPESVPPETPASIGRVLDGHIELANVGFAYGHSEAPVLQSVSFTIEPGETVAIIGSSGGGKTTLLKLLLGFYQPTEGVIRYDGIPLAKLGLPVLRKQIGAVMQEDCLYTGTIAENIAFFAPEYDLNNVREAAKLAAIDDEILRMPMGYDSLVGDMGSSLSGGQKQRIVLARALYRKPRILFLDEGTAHLDVRTEAKVNAAIAQLGITRVIVAHRPETIRCASRILAIAEGRLVECRKQMVA